MKSVIRSFALFVLVAAAGVLSPRSAHAVEINIVYTDGDGTNGTVAAGFNDPVLGPKRRESFEAAVQYWERKLQGSVPITVHANFEAGGVAADTFLAQAGPTSFVRDFAGAMTTETRYPIAIANQLHGADLTPNDTADAPAHEIEATFNSDIDALGYEGLRWYYGTDGNPPRLGTNAAGGELSDFDFFSTAMHELGHGLGFVSLLDNQGAFFGGVPAIYDRYLATDISASSPRVASLTLEQRKVAVVSNRLYFAGPNARRAEGNSFNSRVYAPFIYLPGSSTSHLNEDTYHGINELMTPFYSEAVNQAGPVALGVLADMGWQVPSFASEPLPSDGPEPVLTAIGRIVYSAGGDLWIMNANGTGKRRLTSGTGNDTQPALSYQGDKVVFVSDRDGNKELYMMSSEGGTPTRLTTNQVEDADPSFRQDGSRILYTSSSGNRTINVLLLSDRSISVLSPTTVNSYSPSYSLTGSQIVFASTRTGDTSSEIYRMSGSGGVATRLTNDAFNDTQPAFSRDARLIAFTSTRDGNEEIYTISYTGGTPVRLTKNLSSDSNPRFSPYQNFIVFQSNLRGTLDIYAMNTTGTTLYRLTSETTPDTSPFWGGGNGAPAVTPTPTPTPTATATPTPTPSATPTNNDFLNAFPIFGSSGSQTGTTVNATKESGEPRHGGNDGGKSVWYKWVAPVTGNVAFDTAGSAFDTILGVYTGPATNPTVSTLSTVAGNDDSATGVSTSRVIFSAVRDRIYYIAVDGFRTTDGIAASGALTLNWRFTSAPVNDDFAGATTISGASGQINGSNSNATRETNEPNHSGNAGGASIWYRWTAPANGSVTFSTLGSNFDTLLAAYSGTSVGALTQIAANDDASTSTNTSAITFSAVATRVYYIAVDGFSGATGTVVLRWTQGDKGQADVQVKTATSDFVGNNIYNSTGNSQNQTQTVSPGSTATFFVRLQNDGNVLDQLTVKGTNLNQPDRKAKYFYLGSEVTAQVVAGSFKTPSLRPGGVADLKVDVSFTSFTVATLETVAVTATSVKTPAASDTVKMFTRIASSSTATAKSSTTDISLSSANADSTTSEVVLTFAASLDVNSASDATHYRVEAGGSTVEIDSASYSAATNTVRLALPLGAVRSGQSVNVAWNNLRDPNGRLASPGQVTLTAR
ncbi:MAG TPA: pre-peptidase C-terminal domain-containing protein [Abditibacteriaceae bacterium]|jgi:hypothetical protein